MIITIGKQDITLKIVNDETIAEAIEKETKCKVIMMRWIDKNTVLYVCGGECEFGHKLISGNIKVRE